MTSLKPTWLRSRQPGPAKRRSGKVLVLLAMVLPCMAALIALVLDGGFLAVAARRAQHAADAAATAAAMDVALQQPEWRNTAESMIKVANGLPNAVVTVASPPASGKYAGRSGFVFVELRQNYQPFLPNVFSDAGPLSVAVRAIAGREPATSPVAVILLDPKPPTVTIDPIPVALPSVNPLLGGLEVVGLGALSVNGAIVVNCTWGGVDEQGRPVGESSGPPNACSCTPLLPLTRVRTTDIRVVGGVDDPANYDNLDGGDVSPLQANRLPTADPLAGLPVPTLTSDSRNVSGTTRGAVNVITLPFITTVLEPGVYDWISVVSGSVRFNPGIYIIRGANPATRLALSIAAADVRAEGVMFYITNTANYLPTSGSPDSSDGETSPGGGTIQTLAPSVLINVGLTSRFSPINDPSSPFDGLLLYQRRQDRRPIIILKQELIGSTSFSGNIYAKWAHVILSANGTLRSAVACGSLKVLEVLNLTIDPIKRLPPAEDVYLVE